ncbi:hypothetical protein DXV76_00570 [Rhodobacteraceae bacterium CCMM004]|nr:hypothetical protein DXV76_00570 [Rhodobacteraceae bacterium CCMM004]
MTPIRPLAALALAALTACGGDGIGPVRYEVPPSAPADKVAVSVGSVEVREVSLPLYAALETITVQAPDGALITDDDVLWADDPARAMTERLALTLAARTRARVAAEPWPFADPADARVEVRFTQALPGADGQYRIAGQYFVASAFGEGRDVARRFALAAPYVPGSVAAIAAARGRVLDELALLIARQGL